MAYFYVKIDKTSKEDNAGFGFANKKTAIAFKHKKTAIEFIAKRSIFDFSCKLITRKEASKYASEFYGLKDKIDFVVFFDNGVKAKGILIGTENIDFA